MLRFGQSTRLYLYGGPEELMPEEGLTKAQRKQAALLEVRRRAKGPLPPHLNMGKPLHPASLLKKRYLIDKFPITFQTSAPIAP